MSAIDLVGRSPLVDITATSVAVPIPAGWLPDDLAVVQLQQVSGDSAVTAPAGWTLQQRVQRTTTHVSSIYTRKLATADAGAGHDGETFNATFTATSQHFLAVAQVHRGVDTTTPVDVAIASSSGTITGGTLIRCTATTPTHLGRQVAFVSVATGTAPLTTPVSYDVTYRALGQWSDMDDAGVTGIYPTFAHLGAGDYSDITTSMASTFYDIANVLAAAPLHSFVTRTDAAYIWHVLTLRAADQSATPPVTTDLLTAASAQTYQLRALCSQPPLRAHGVLLAPSGVIDGDPKIVLQVSSPTRQDGGPPETYGDGTFGEGWYAGEQWIDLSALARGLSWGSGAESPGDRDRTGVLTVTLDSISGEASPFATSGELTNGGLSWLVSGRPIRVAITKNVAGADSWKPLYTGVIETVEESFTDNADAYVTVTATDTTALLTLDSRTAQTPAGSGDDLLERVGRILSDQQGTPWPFGLNASTWDVAEGVTAAIAATLQPTTLSGDPLTELYLAGDSDGTRILSDRHGSLRLAPTSPTSLVPRYVFANDPVGADLPVADLTPYSSNERILNRANGGRAGGSSLSRVDDGSIGRHGPLATGYGFPRTDLISQTDDQVLALLLRNLKAHADDYLGIAELDLDGDLAPADLFPALIDLAASALVSRYVVEVDWTHPTAGTLFVFLAVVAGMTHNLTMEGDQAKWTATIELAKAVLP